MKDHIDAIVALLAGLGWGCYYVEAPDSAPLPYLVLWGSGGLPPEEVQVAGDLDLTDRLGVTHAAATPIGVLLARTAVREVLDRGRPAVTGRSVVLHLTGSERTQVDRDVTHPDTGEHPAFGVDFYQLTSVPA